MYIKSIDLINQHKDVLMYARKGTTMKTFIETTLTSVNAELESITKMVKAMKANDENTSNESKAISNLKTKIATLNNLNYLCDASEQITSLPDIFRNTNRCANISNFTRKTSDGKYTVMVLDTALSAVDFSSEYEVATDALEYFKDTITKLATTLGFYEMAIEALETYGIYAKIGTDMVMEVSSFDDTVSYAKSKKIINEFMNKNHSLLGREDGPAGNVFMPAPMVKAMLCQCVKSLAKNALASSKADGKIAMAAKNKIGVEYTICFVKRGEFYTKLQHHIAYSIKGKEKATDENENGINVKSQEIK